MSVLKSKYEPTVCCNHRWVNTHTKHDLTCQECDKCGATCGRDESGMISHYSTVTADMMDKHSKPFSRRN